MAFTMITDRHSYGGGYISLPFICLAGLPDTIETHGYELTRKTEFHISLVAVEQLAALIDPEHPEVAIEGLKQSFMEFTSEHDLTKFCLTGEYRLVKRGERVSVIALVELEGLNELFSFLRSRHGVDLPLQPAHITTYTLQPDTGIDITSNDRLDATKPVDILALNSCRIVEYSKELQIARGIAHRAGEIMRRYFYCDQQCVEKSDGSPVTVADKTVNSLVIKELARLFPEEGVIGEEESTTSYGTGRKWFCDPVDGTRAYTWGLPSAMFSLALVVDGAPTVGVAYDPFLDRMFYAEKGLGAFCNTAPLRVSDLTLDDGIVAITSNPQKLRASSRYLEEIFRRGITTACFSGAVYKSCLVAAGRMVGYVQEGVSGHDMAAVQVIVMEAGGRVTDLDGRDYDYTKPFHGTILSNGTTHDELVSLVKDESSTPSPHRQ